MPNFEQNAHFGADIGQAKSALEEYASILQNQQIKIKELTGVLVEYNDKSNKARVELRGLTEDNKRISGVLKEVAGGYKVASAALGEKIARTKEEIASVKEHIKQQKLLERELNKDIQDRLKANLKQENTAFKEKLREETRLRKDSLRDQLAFEAEIKSQFLAKQAQGIIPGALAGIGFDPSKLNTGQIQAARTAINNLNSAFIAGRVNAKDIQVAINSLNTGSLVPLSGGAGIAATQLGNLNSIMKQTAPFVNLTTASLVRLALVFGFRQILIGIIQEFKALISESLAFDTAITKLTVSTNNINIGQLTNKLKELSVQFGTSKIDLANAELEIYRNNTDKSSKANTLLQTSLELSKVTFSKVEESAKALTGTLNAFNLEADKQNEVSKILFATYNRGRAPLAEIEKLFEQTGANAVKLGIPLKDIATAFVLLRDKGKPANEAISELNTALTKFAIATPEFTKILEKSGFTSGQQAISTLKFEGALRLLNKAAEEANGNFTQLGKSSHNFRAELALASGTNEFNKIGKELDDLGEKEKKALDTVLNSTQEKVNRTNQAFKDFFSNISDATVKTYGDISDTTLRFFTKNEERLKINTDAVTKEYQKQADIAKSALTKTEDSYNTFFNKIGVLFAQRIFEIQQNQRNLADSFKVSGDAVLDSLKENISETKRAITEAQSAIKNSQKAIFSDSERFEKESFDRRLRLLSPQNQFQEINAKIVELRKQGSDLFGQGTPESGKEGREKFNEANALIIKQIELSNRTQNSISRQQTAIQKLLQASDQHINKALEGEARLKNSQTLRIQESLEHTRKLREAGQDQTAKDNELIRHAEQLNKISNANKPDRVGEISEATAAKITQELNKQADALRNAIPYLTLNEKLEAKLKLNLIEKNKLELEHQKLLKQTIEDNKAILAGEEAKLRRTQQLLKEISEPVFGSNNKLKKQFEDKDSAAKFFQDKNDELLKTIPLDTLQKNPQFLLDLEKLKNSKLQEIDVKFKQEQLEREQKHVADLINIKKKEFEKLPSEIEKDKDSVNKALQSLRDQPRTIGAIITGADKEHIEGIKESIDELIKEPTDIVLEQVEKKIRAFKKQVNLTVNNEDDRNNFISALTDLQEKVNILKFDINQIPASKNIVDDLQSRLNNLNKSINVEPLDSLNKNVVTFDSILLRASAGVENLARTLESFPKNVEGHASGGLITSGSGSRSDDVLTKASRGEFIVNSDATSKFLPQLIAMNSRGFADGGLISGPTTNVGDININVKGGDTAETTLREIGYGLERQLRRRTIRLTN